MNYRIVKTASDLAGWSKDCEALSLYHELSKLEDRRGKKGKRYQLAYSHQLKEDDKAKLDLT
jgi:hypothetical protein